MPAPLPTITDRDAWVFGWNPTPAIVSVWAEPDGTALVWQRLPHGVVCTSDSFRPWVLVASLTDVAHLGTQLRAVTAADAATAQVTFQVLDGPPDSYRFLLTAADSRTLDRAIRYGAGQRTGTSVRSLHDLDTVYHVGLVEQYLMQTGRVFFRGLAYADLHRLQFDLETTALAPAEGRIFLVAVRDTQGLATILEAPTAADEAQLIHDLAALIRERDPDVIENHNLFGFDLPFLQVRAQTLGVPLHLGRAEGPRRTVRYQNPHSRRDPLRVSIPGRECIDTLDAARRHAFVVGNLPSQRLKDVARSLGVAAPDRVYLPGATIAAEYERDPATVRRYALDDVTEVDALSQRLLVAPFALAGMAPRRYERLAAAGPAMGVLEPMLVRAYLRAGAALPRHSDRTVLRRQHAGGAAYCFATGVATQVIKADIASLYPSLMRTYQIGPASDRLGVLLTLVDWLTDERLHHKAAMHTALDPLSRSHHQATQAAMKLIINAAYGYLGAGTMALFADPDAADAVTREGRAVLDQVLTAFRARGVALIEADTDGVYLAVPPGWNEAMERALVAEIDALLPPMIHLAYEGRYQAMYSHEIKNYALLTYAGDLEVRGVAFRSRRAEPFGERFVRDALRCVLVGDLAGVQQVYETTIASIQRGELPTADMAARLRVSKTPEQYAARRAQQREAVYEAMLAVGRTTWTVGQRVRCYRGVQRAPTLLPDAELGAEPSDPRDYDRTHYVTLLRTVYAARLRSACDPADFAQLFRANGQHGLFDRPASAMTVRRIVCPADGTSDTHEL